MPISPIVASRICVAAACTIAASSPAAAQTASGAVNITGIRTGWAIDAFGIESVRQTVVNPANCAVPDAYQIDGAQPGYKTHIATVLLAFASGRPVYITLSNSTCSQSRPMVIGLAVYR